MTMNSPRNRKLKTRTRNWSRSVGRLVIDKCSLLSIRSTFRVVYLSPAVFPYPQLARRLWNRLLYSGRPSPYSLSRCMIYDILNPLCIMDCDTSIISCNRTVISMILQTAVSYCVVMSPFAIDLDPDGARGSRSYMGTNGLRPTQCSYMFVVTQAKSRFEAYVFRYG